MPTSAVSRSRNPSTTVASRAASALPSSTRLARQQRAGPSYTSAGVVADCTVTGKQEDTATTTKSRSLSSKSAGVERNRLGRVLQQHVRADVHSDQSNRSSSSATQQQQQQQQPSCRSSRSTPATDARRSGLPRASGSTSVDAAKCRSRSTATDAGRQTAAASVVADNDKTLLPRLSASSSTSNAEKSEEELEKMRILARHIKVCVCTPQNRNRWFIIAAKSTS